MNESDNTTPIESVESFIAAVRKDSACWGSHEPKWFRGEPNIPTALLPSLYRGFASHENALLQTFRARAGGFHDTVPIREHTDQWLFLARHSGLPTRLLDWSEGALLGLYFALQADEPVVWMLNPLELNELSYTNGTSPVPKSREFRLPWHNPGDPRFAKYTNPAFENLRGAWEEDQFGVASDGHSSNIRSPPASSTTVLFRGPGARYSASE